MNWKIIGGIALLIPISLVWGYFGGCYIQDKLDSKELSSDEKNWKIRQKVAAFIIIGPILLIFAPFLKTANFIKRMLLDAH